MESLKTLVAVCLAQRIFELLMPKSELSRQLKTVCGMVFLAVLVNTIIGFFGR